MALRFVIDKDARKDGERTVEAKVFEKDPIGIWRSKGEVSVRVAPEASEGDVLSSLVDNYHTITLGPLFGKTIEVL
ncbi:MAG: hypothetical protein HYX82_02950 [Chloroflexi bacterium]|nr:hypothetical protein [Chloroflexota bacterium]